MTLRFLVFFPYVMNVLEYNWDVSDGKKNLLVSRKIGWLIYKKKMHLLYDIEVKQILLGKRRSLWQTLDDLYWGQILQLCFVRSKGTERGYCPCLHWALCTFKLLQWSNFKEEAKNKSSRNEIWSKFGLCLTTQPYLTIVR